MKTFKKFDGAVLSVLPFIFGCDLLITSICLLLGIFGLLIAGCGITLTRDTPVAKAGGILGVVAACVTFALGWLMGGRLG